MTHTAARQHKADTNPELSDLGHLGDNLIMQMSRTCQHSASLLELLGCAKQCHCYNAVHAGVLSSTDSPASFVAISIDTFPT